MPASSGSLVPNRVCLPRWLAWAFEGWWAFWFRYYPKKEKSTPSSRLPLLLECTWLLGLGRPSPEFGFALPVCSAGLRAFSEDRLGFTPPFPFRYLSASGTRGDHPWSDGTSVFGQTKTMARRKTTGAKAGRGFPLALERSRVCVGVGY